MIILDTDTLTLVQRESGSEYQRLARRLRLVPDEMVCVTIVSFEEQMRGWLAVLARARTVEDKIAAFSRLQRSLDSYRKRPIVDFDEAPSNSPRPSTVSLFRA